MDKKCKLIADYKTHMLSAEAFALLFGDDPSGYPDSVKIFFNDDIVLSEPDSLPWGGLWHGREGLAGEGKAFSAAFGVDYNFDFVSASLLPCDDKTVYRNFEINIARRDDPTRVYHWRGVERYDFSGDKISYLDVYYKDPTGMMKFMGLTP